MKKISLFFTVIMLAFALTLSACDFSGGKQSGTLFAMDTYMQLDVYGSKDVFDKLESEIERLDKLLSSTDSESDIYKLNKSGTATVGEDTAELIKRSLELCAESGGNLDITVYPLVEEWGFISQNYKIPDKTVIESLLKKVDYKAVSQNGNAITLPEGAKLDLGAVAKGYAADKSKEILESGGVNSALLNLGGTVLAYGKKPDGSKWKVGITDPENTSGYIGSVECEDKIIATSGSYERYFEGEDGKTYCHIIDPETGYPADNGVTSVTIISDDGTKCDALSTALFVMGAEKALQYCEAHTDFDCVILTADKKAYITKGLENTFKLKDGSEYEIIKES